jgi:8-oxo-dGTP diphosphatase
MTTPLPTVDWARWTPRVRATLLFVFHGEQVLLIRKKRGLGAGKINGPGGKLDPGETPAQAAVREVVEEVGVRPLDPVSRGLLRFQFTDGLAMEVHPFTATRHEGEARETDEAEPLWMHLSALPFDQMWADDRYWLPAVLAGKNVDLQAIFDGDQMLWHRLRTLPGPG